MIRIEKRLTLDGVEFPLVSDRVELELGAVGQGFFHVTAAEAPAANGLARFFAGYGGQSMAPVLSGRVTEARQARQGEWRVWVKEPAYALDAPAAFALRHPTPAVVLAAITAATGLEFLLPGPEAPAPGHYLSRRLPYYYAPGTCRQALDAMAAAWGVPDGVWATLPDGRVFWGDWKESHFNTDALAIPAELVMERDPEARAYVVPYMPRLRPGAVVQVGEAGGGGMRFVIKRASLMGDKARLEWGKVG